MKGESAGNPEAEAPETGHVSVLEEEVARWLGVAQGAVILDCTVGTGGHAARLSRLAGPQGRLLGLDWDPRQLPLARRALEDAPASFELEAINFAEAPSWLDRLGIEKVTVIFADLGFASNQMVDPGRGLSFQTEGPLDMRYSPRTDLTAADLVRDATEKDLSDLLYRFGEERRSRRIARQIVRARRAGQIETTGQLAEIVRRALGPSGRARRGRIDPATRTFQALRIAVNRELANLEALLAWAPERLLPGGRIGIISFHSLEDRLIKRNFLHNAREGVYRILTPKPITAGQEERRRNRRSRSAKLRVSERAPNEGRRTGTDAGRPTE